eukprot:6182585-Pleurochrysis_carterae.AAC.1
MAAIVTKGIPGESRSSARRPSLKDMRKLLEWLCVRVCKRETARVNWSGYSHAQEESKQRRRATPERMAYRGKEDACETK